MISDQGLLGRSEPGDEGQGLSGGFDRSAKPGEVTGDRLVLGIDRGGFGALGRAVFGEFGPEVDRRWGLGIFGLAIFLEGGIETFEGDVRLDLGRFAFGDATVEGIVSEAEGQAVGLAVDSPA